MTAQQNFRTAFNGFNREDVVHYIEYLNARHAAEISQLNSELDYLRSKQPEALPTPEPDPVIEQQAARIRELFDRCKELEAELEALKAEKSQPSAVSQAAELEAYRRAERVERLARERAEQICHQVNGTLADATVRVDKAAALLSGVTDQVAAHLEQLQTAVASSRQALTDAAASMYALRPEAEEA